VAYTQEGILSSLNKKANSHTSYNVEEPWGHYAKLNNPDPKILCGSTDMRYLDIVKFIETENKIVGWMESCCSRVESLVWEYEKVLQMDGCTTMWI
jgi:hypothetical protein